MTADPLPSLEVVGQVMQRVQTAYYFGMSATVMFIWDYGELTDPNDSFSV